VQQFFEREIKYHTSRTLNPWKNR